MELSIFQIATAPAEDAGPAADEAEDTGSEAGGADGGAGADIAEEQGGAPLDDDDVDEEGGSEGDAMSVKGQLTTLSLPSAEAFPMDHPLYGYNRVTLCSALFPPRASLQDPMHALAGALDDVARPHAVILLRSGRFAGAVFHGQRMGAHKTITKYTTRRGQGGSQSAMDGTGKKPKSAGAMLRRHGEASLRAEVEETLARWRADLDGCAMLFIACPKSMRDHLFGPQGSAGALGAAATDPRVRSIPFPTQRPTLQEVKNAHRKLTTVKMDLAEAEPEPPAEAEPAPQQPPAPPGDAAPAAAPAPLPAPQFVVSRLGETLRGIVASRDGDALSAALGALSSEERLAVLVERDEEGSTLLHVCCAAGSADGVLMLLEAGADPTLRDFRSRTPPQCCEAKAQRDAFRRFRAAAPERFDWTALGVGDAITEATEEEAQRRRREKAREKKRRQRLNKKKRKDEEQQEAEAQRERDELRRKREKEQKALEEQNAPRCDACGKRLRPSFTPFYRLDYTYCSSKCIQDHKRQLMAEAAARRFGGGGSGGA